MRLFIAIELGDQVKRKLRTIQTALNNFIIKGNETAFDNYHITLRFIGDVDEAETEKLKEAIDDAASQMGSFNLRLDQLDQFPRKNKAIIWVGLNGQRESLFKLKELLDNALELNGRAKEEQGYHPHITLIRQAVLNRPFEETKYELTIPEEAIHVRGISLMESKRIDGKLIYNTVHHATFLR